MHEGLASSSPRDTPKIQTIDEQRIAPRSCNAYGSTTFPSSAFDEEARRRRQHHNDDHPDRPLHQKAVQGRRFVFASCCSRRPPGTAPSAACSRDLLIQSSKFTSQLEACFKFAALQVRWPGLQASESSVPTVAPPCQPPRRIDESHACCSPTTSPSCTGAGASPT
jgi:hypothetical protein